MNHAAGRIAMTAPVGKEASRIEGSDFVSYLSRAERKYIIENFADSRHRVIGQDEGLRDRTRGVFLDVKA